MLNQKGERELAYIVTIDEIRNIEGVNNQVAVVNGWTVFVKRDEYKAGDKAVYIEIDSKVPETEAFAFLEKYKYRVKTQKFVKGLVISQGLLIKPSDVGLEKAEVGDFVTEKLGITYYEAEDNARKADVSKYTSMQARHKKFFKTKLGKWLMKREWGRKLCFFFLGKKKDKKTDWPAWVVKTDEERCQNCFNHRKSLDLKWYVTEKIDGTSTTFTMKQAKPKKRELLVCSRNVVFNKPEKEDKNFYKDTDGNVYLEMADKYNMEAVLNSILDKHPDYDYITIQGETFGGSVQKRNYGPEHRMYIFNIIYKENGKAPVRMNPSEMADFVHTLNTKNSFNLCCVPILDHQYELPETIEELLAYAGSEASKIDGGMREGVVFRSSDGVHSFKAVDNEFLLKYHG
jgi:hypothetical protein